MSLFNLNYCFQIRIFLLTDPRLFLTYSHSLKALILIRLFFCALIPILYRNGLLSYFIAKFKYITSMVFPNFYKISFF